MNRGFLRLQVSLFNPNRASEFLPIAPAKKMSPQFSDVNPEVHGC